MLIRIMSGIATASLALESGDFVEWTPDDEARRLIEKGLAEEASKGDAAGHKIKRYESRPATPEQRWPGMNSIRTPKPKRTA